MTMNLLPEKFEAANKRFQNLFPNFFLSPWANFFDENLISQELTGKGVQIYEQDNQLHVEVPLPGLDLKDMEVSLNRGNLLIKGDAKEEEKDKKKKFYRFSEKKYSYSLALPVQIDEKQEPQALYTDGILNISLHLAKKDDTKKISIKAGSAKK